MTNSILAFIALTVSSRLHDTRERLVDQQAVRPKTARRLTTRFERTRLTENDDSFLRTKVK